jgi:hypothetical protein
LGQEREVEGGKGWARSREGEVVSTTTQTREEMRERGKKRKERGKFPLLFPSRPFSKRDKEKK